MGIGYPELTFAFGMPGRTTGLPAEGPSFAGVLGEFKLGNKLAQYILTYQLETWQTKSSHFSFLH